MDSNLYRVEHFQYQGNFYPLEDVGFNYFNVEVHTTFDLCKTLVVTAQATSDSLHQQTEDELLALSGFVAFDLEVPFDWTNLEGHVRQDSLTDDDDVSIYTGYQQYASKQSLEILERLGNQYKMKIAWYLEGSTERPATAFGWFIYRGVILHVDDKIFGEKRREYLRQYGETTPKELLEQLDEDIRKNAWEVLCGLAPGAKDHYEEPTVHPGNVCSFEPRK